jgi:hypothetical protein
MPIATTFFATVFVRCATSAHAKQRPRALRAVNTSLSGKLFFSTRWCIREGVHFDSRVHTASKPVSLDTEGIMAKKAKKAKKAKSAVKKTAKKTRKVAKKKK